MTLLVSESQRRLGILNTNCNAAVTSKSCVCREFRVLKWQQWKQRRDLLERRTAFFKEYRRHSLFVPFKVRKGKLSRKVCSVYHWGMNWVYT